MRVVAANAIVADIATEFDLTYSAASQFFNGVLDEDADWVEGDDQSLTGDFDASSDSEEAAEIPA